MSFTQQKPSVSKGFNHKIVKKVSNIQDYSKNTSGIPEISSSEMGSPKKTYQQTVTLNNMKGL